MYIKLLKSEFEDIIDSLDSARGYCLYIGEKHTEKIIEDLKIRIRNQEDKAKINMSNEDYGFILAALLLEEGYYQFSLKRRYGRYAETRKRALIHLIEKFKREKYRQLEEKLKWDSRKK